MHKSELGQNLMIVHVRKVISVINDSGERQLVALRKSWNLTS